MHYTKLSILGVGLFCFCQSHTMIFAQTNLPDAIESLDDYFVNAKKVVENYRYVASGDSFLTRERGATPVVVQDTLLSVGQIARRDLHRYFSIAKREHSGNELGQMRDWDESIQIGN